MTYDDRIGFRHSWSPYMAQRCAVDDLDVDDCPSCHISHEFGGTFPHFPTKANDCIPLFPFDVDKSPDVWFQCPCLLAVHALLLSCQANEPLHLETLPTTGASWLLSGHPRRTGEHPPRLIKHHVRLVCVCTCMQYPPRTRGRVFYNLLHS